MSITKILLLEFQEKNYLYHFTDYRIVKKILRSNVLKRGTINLAITNSGKTFDIDDKEQGVSFTRNRNFQKDAMWGSNALALVFDRNKLKSRYKIYPLDPESNTKYRQTYKEEVILKDIKNVRNLIEFVYIGPHLTKQFHGGIYDALTFISTYQIPIKTFKNGNFVDFSIHEYN